MPTFYRGHRRLQNKDHLIAVMHERHRGSNAALRFVVPPAAWDSRTKGWIPPIKDQGQCGSCWDFSGTGVCEVAYLVAGKQGGPFSEEYTLSCGQNGGCNGDDNTTVLTWAKAKGLPASADYGPYDASAGSCKWTASMKLYQIQDWGFADGSGGNGVTPTQDIKQAIMTYGCVGCAVAAGSDWDSVGPGSTITGTSSSIDHDVILVGWDDAHDNGDGSKGAWIMRNSWGTSWGDAGYAWIKYGADSIGTESVWATAGTPVPPTPPTPPTPPVPPPTPTFTIPALTVLLDGVGIPIGHTVPVTVPMKEGGILHDLETYLAAYGKILPHIPLPVIFTIIQWLLATFGPTIAPRLIAWVQTLGLPPAIQAAVIAFIDAVLGVPAK